MSFRAFKGIDFGKGIALARDLVANALLLKGTGLRIVSGNLVLTSGNLTLDAGNLTMTAGKTDGLRTNLVIDTTAAVSPTLAQSGTVFVATASSGAYAVTLPTGPPAGITYTFVTGHAGNEIAITAEGTDTIYALADDSGASINDGVVTNTGGTNILGDRITIVSDGVSAWWAISQAGVWAAS